VIEGILKLVVSYLLGSILGSVLIARLTGRPDIRTVGSGNPGSTNALRTQGKLFALGVIVIDVGKGWLAAAVLPSLPPHLADCGQALRPWLPAVCGAAVMLGHVYPLWYGFRGGKAVATFMGAVLGIAPRLLIPVLLAWFGVVVLSGFIGLASMAAALVLPLCAVWLGPAGHRPLLEFGAFCAALIVFTHRSNISRMRAGCEPRARRLWLFGRGAPRS
jgi:acyl phosphate:glycerol-3-phosphate acyltransferase